MNCHDVIEPINRLNATQLAQVVALIQGQVLSFENIEYRYVSIGDPLMEYPGEELSPHAAESGIYQRMYVFDTSVEQYTPENAKGFTWCFVTNDLIGFLATREPDKKQEPCLSYAPHEDGFRVFEHVSRDPHSEGETSRYVKADVNDESLAKLLVNVGPLVIKRRRCLPEE
jgi:hypothetical protein